MTFSTRVAIQLAILHAQHRRAARAVRPENNPVGPDTPCAAPTVASRGYDLTICDRSRLFSHDLCINSRQRRGVDLTRLPNPGPVEPKAPSSALLYNVRYCKN